MKSEQRTQAAIDAGHPEWAELPATLEAAKALKDAYWYFTELPVRVCRHVAPRSRSSGRCWICHHEKIDNDKKAIANRLRLAAVEQHGADPAFLKLPARVEEARKLNPWPDDLPRQYFTGKPCVRGHYSSRGVASSDCRECSRHLERSEIALERQLRWAKSEKGKEAAKKQTKRTSERRKADPAFAERLREAERGYRKRRMAKINADPELRVAYLEKERAYRLAANDQEYVREYQKRPAVRARTLVKRLCVERNAPLWLSEEQIKQMEDIYISAQEKSAKEGKPYHVDHIIPKFGRNLLTGEEAVCGLSVPWNLSIEEGEINMRKGARVNLDDAAADHFDWLVANGLAKPRNSLR